MTKIAIIRALVALAVIHGLVVHQMDVKIVFHNGDLEQDIYMAQPEGCTIPKHKNKICTRRKYLYGLKQAPKQWYEKFDSTVVQNSFIINTY